MNKMEPIRRSQLLKGLEGKWVAVKDGIVIGASERPDDLYADLHRKRIGGATILRVPDHDEPEMVGLG